MLLYNNFIIIFIVAKSFKLFLLLLFFKLQQNTKIVISSLNV